MLFSSNGLTFKEFKGCCKLKVVKIVVSHYVIMTVIYASAQQVSWVVLNFEWHFCELMLHIDYYIPSDNVNVSIATSDYLN